MVYTVTLHFSETEYPRDEFTVNAKDIDEALFEVTEMIKNKEIVLVDKENVFYEVKYCRAVNMGLVTKFEISKS